MANRLNKVVKKGSKPIPVKIVSTSYDGPQPMVKHGIDKYEAQEALRTLQRAAEIKSNKALLRAAEKEAANQMKALSAVCKK